jgi:hypothetical protein
MTGDALAWDFSGWARWTLAPQGQERRVKFSSCQLQTPPPGVAFIASNSARVRRSLAAAMEAEEVLLPWQVFGDRPVRDIRFAVAPAPSIEEIGAVWRRLDDAGQTTFFVSWPWIGMWLRRLPESERPLHQGRLPICPLPLRALRRQQRQQTEKKAAPDGAASNSRILRNAARSGRLCSLAPAAA